MVNILVVEDEQRVAGVLKKGLEESGYQVSVAYDGQMAIRLFRSGSYQLIISDVILPGMNGFEFCREVRQINPDIPILMLTALGTTDDKLEGFDAGADDYMVKPFDFRELTGRIKVLLKRRGGVAEEKMSDILRYADLEVNLAAKEVIRGETKVRLTPKEFNLLVYMVKNAGRLLTRMEIAENVWDTHFDTGTNFIDVYINYLRKKIDKDFPVKLIHTKPGMGFIFRTEDEDPY
ncbi:MAG: response regulator transcription factor [Bacteroides sp.]|nr:response regulator transcription factor [Bacteroides sp.]